MVFVKLGAWILELEINAHFIGKFDILRPLSVFYKEKISWCGGSVMLFIKDAAKPTFNYKSIDAFNVNLKGNDLKVQ